MPRNIIESAETALKAAPPTGVAGLTVAGISLPDWVILLTLVYLALQIGGWVSDRFFRGDKNDRK